MGSDGWVGGRAAGMETGSVSQPDSARARPPDQRHHVAKGDGDLKELRALSDDARHRSIARHERDERAGGGGLAGGHRAQQGAGAVGGSTMWAGRQVSASLPAPLPAPSPQPAPRPARLPAAHLAVVHVLAGVPLQARVVDALHQRVLRQPLGDAARVGHLPLHAQRHGLQAAHQQPAVLRAQCGALCVLRRAARAVQARGLGRRHGAWRAQPPSTHTANPSLPQTHAIPSTRP